MDKEGAVRGKEEVQGGGRAATGEWVQMKRRGREEYVLEGKGLLGEKKGSWRRWREMRI